MQRFRVAHAPPKRSPLTRLRGALLGIVALLVIVGVTMVQSAGQVTAIAAGANPYGGLMRQGGFAVVGLVGMAILSRVRLATIRRYSWVALLIGFALQLLVYTPLGHEAGGNRNWLRLGPMSLQPAEFMKFVLVVWVSTVLATKRQLLGRWVHVVIPVIPVVALSMFINVMGGDLGTLMIITALVFGCLFFAQVRLRFLGSIALIALVGIGVMTLIKPNRVFRVMHFLEVDCFVDTEHAYDMCWQSLNGFWALANGGVTGTGLGGSRAKWFWLPEADNDFIFAVLGEELGLLGGVALLGLFVALVWVLLRIMHHCDDPFAWSLIGGTATWIAAQMTVNVAVVLGFVPVLGVPLPFISAGGTSLVSALLAMGVVFACIREQVNADATGTVQFEARG
ncbi:FtsW/RodA/SpoVE family cell cycle protein [Leucobacter chinensis]|uniref:FtsW/RodA/SpoVE family cell cycle protein n=1 Tax=Leucobacter chinensis TaxID=2851010 RepID=UPI001C237B09|nr:FtsW/RodA/SpoVE family cell cycle protein [Leucobacter chinensis]